MAERGGFTADPTCSTNIASHRHVHIALHIEFSFIQGNRTAYISFISSIDKLYAPSYEESKLVVHFSYRTSRKVAEGVIEGFA